MNENDGRSPASQGRAGGLRPEPATQSQPEALVPNAAYALRCIVCRQSLRNLHMPNQPSGGVEFSSPGHYGTTVFDPMDGSVIAVNICDGCLVSAGDAGDVLYCVSGGKPHLWRPPASVDRSGEAGETPLGGSTVGESAARSEAKGDAQ